MRAGVLNLAPGDWCSKAGRCLLWGGQAEPLKEKLIVPYYVGKHSSGANGAATTRMLRKTVTEKEAEGQSCVGEGSFSSK